MERNVIARADALTYLKTLPDSSVDTCVTSPPYFNLRDYKISEWVGGDPTCDHMVGRFATTTPVSEKQLSNHGSGLIQARTVCPKCGAERQGLMWDAVTYSPLVGMAAITIPESREELGGESSIEAYIGHLLAIFREVKRVLKPSGVFWLNIGDSYSAGGRGTSEHHSMKMGVGTAAAQNLGAIKPPVGYRPKSLLMIPARIAMALVADGWILRQDAIWSKTNSMPGSQQDRFTTAHEYIFHFVKQEHYWFDLDAVTEPVAESTQKDKLHSERRPTQHKRWEIEMASNKTTLGVAALQPPTRTKRSVLTVTTAPSAYDFCRCGRLYIGRERKRVREKRIDPDTGKLRLYMKPCLACGRDDQYVSHFAAYPVALIKPLILSACPPLVCAECGTPYERMVERTSISAKASDSHANDGTNNKEVYADNNPHRMRLTQHDQAVGRGGNVSYTDPLHEKAYVATRTLGWQKMCACDCAETRRGVVLDPFMGSGTTAMTALSLDRDYLGCDPNADYVGMAVARIARWRHDPQFRRGKPAPPETPQNAPGARQLTLFDP